MKVMNFDGGPYHIESRFYMIGASVTKELNNVQEIFIRGAIKCFSVTVFPGGTISHLFGIPRIKSKIFGVIFKRTVRGATTKSFRTVIRQ